MKKIRIQVGLNEALVKRIDQYADSLGMTRSGLCAFFIGQAVLGTDKAFEVSLKAAQSLLSDSAEDLSDNSSKIDSRAVKKATAASSDNLPGQMDISDLIENDGQE